MSLAARFSRRARWAVPAGAVAAVGVVVAGSVLTSASAAPSLPARTPAQLIAAIAASKSAPSAFSGVIVTNSALGLPDLPGESSGMSISSLLTGSATIDIWYARPAQLRLALPVPLGETDLRVDGAQAWLWDSQTNTATHILPPPDAVRQAVPRAASGMVSPAGPRFRSKSSSSSGASSSGASSSGASSSVAYQSALGVRFAAPTPQQVAQRLLAAVGPTTTVGVQSNVTIAGQPAYQLTLAPKSPSSLIGRVSIAVDATNYLPLRVQVFARGAASPAYQIGFTSISFARPAASNFAFSPPPGARVRTIRLPAGPPLGGVPAVGRQVTIGIPRGKVVRVPANLSCCAPPVVIGGAPVRVRGKAVRVGSLPKGAMWVSVKPVRVGSLPKGPVHVGGKAVRVGGLPKGGVWIGRATVKLPRGATRNAQVALPKSLSKIQRQRLLTAMRANMARARQLHPGVFSWQGPGWYAYAPLTGGTFPGGPGSAARVIGSGWLSVAVLPAAGLTGAAGGEAGALLRAATPVHGSWGSGRLLRTSLLSVLITSDGKVLIGAVTPSVLYADAAQAK